LLERLEIGERYANATGKPLARGGKQIGLLMLRKQCIDVARFDDFDYRSQVAIRIGARRGRAMDATDKTREAPKAHRFAGDQFDPVAAEPQCRDGLARRQAGAPR
jgi:hypothetical protein